MKQECPHIEHIAPTLYSAFDGPFADIVNRSISDWVRENHGLSKDPSEQEIKEALHCRKFLKKLRALEEQFKEDMLELGVDLDSANQRHVRAHRKRHRRVENEGYGPQLILSAFFLIAYFVILGGMFYIEVSDSLNMRAGKNSLLDEISLLIGVLTAGVGQVLSFWYGHKKTSTKVVEPEHAPRTPQLVLSCIFLTVYFVFLVVMLYVESSDQLNMRQGENSMMDELGILFGALTAGVVQILGYWFGGFLKTR
ncbi:hypothetical protein [Rubritalea tangerina]|uniref:Uncharacterized protein n=1 Tax=Rubritalea tangerina TaxID=430798 RepID=A0ABW4ZBX5_9BACT